MKLRNINAVQLSAASPVILPSAAQAAPTSVQRCFKTVLPLISVTVCFLMTSLFTVRSVSLFTLEIVTPLICLKIKQQKRSNGGC